jgi:membrane protein
MARITGRVLGAGAAAGTRVISRGDALRARIAGALNALRRRWHWFDHVATAYGLYNDRQGGTFAGAATFFGFLSFFPLVALAFAVTGYAVVISPDTVHAWLREAINSLAPSLAGKLQIDQIAQARVGAGIFALLGLLIAGLGGVDAYRDGLHAIWGSGKVQGNVIVRKAWDIVVLVAIGLGLIASVAASTLAVSATKGVLASAGFGDSTPAQIATRLLAIAIAVIFNTAIFAFAFSQLSGATVPRHRLLPGAVLAAVGFEALKLIGVYLVARTTHNPVYKSFAVMVGLLVWINLVTRVTFFAAAWTATPARNEGPGRPEARSQEEARSRAEARSRPEGPGVLTAGRPAAPAKPVPGEHDGRETRETHGDGHQDATRR